MAMVVIVVIVVMMMMSRFVSCVKNRVRVLNKPIHRKNQLKKEGIAWRNSAMLFLVAFKILAK